jgi:hypothetical protein
MEVIGSKDAYKWVEHCCASSRGERKEGCLKQFNLNNLVYWLLVVPMVVQKANYIILCFSSCCSLWMYPPDKPCRGCLPGLEALKP